MKYIKDILKGMLIGVANAIPGVSGGTMMVSMGIYDDIIYCVTHLFSQLKKSLKILSPYIIGMAVGIVGFAYIIVFVGTLWISDQDGIHRSDLRRSPVAARQSKRQEKRDIPCYCIFSIFPIYYINAIFWRRRQGSDADGRNHSGNLTVYRRCDRICNNGYPWCERVYDAHDPWLLQPNPLSSQRFYERACKGTVAYDFAVMWIIDSIRTWRCDRYFCYC